MVDKPIPSKVIFSQLFWSRHNFLVICLGRWWQVGHLNTRVKRLHERLLLLLFCSALSESGHVVSSWWRWWLSNVRMSPEYGNCDWFLFLCQWCSACSFHSTLPLLLSVSFHPIFLFPFRAFFCMQNLGAPCSKLPMNLSALARSQICL